MRHLNNSCFQNYYLKFLHDKLHLKYTKDISERYNLYILNNIIYNDKTLITSRFKEFLLYDESSEFLKRFYNSKEIKSKLTKLYDFYDKYSLIQPNYLALDESKYLISNMIKKQIIFNKKQSVKKSNKLLKDNNESIDNKNSKSENQFFTKQIYNEILNESESFINLLFDINTKRKIDNNFELLDEEKDRNDVNKIIDFIQSYENKNVIIFNDENKKNNKKIRYYNLIIYDSTDNSKKEYIHRKGNINSTNYITTSDTYFNNNSNTNKNKSIYKTHKKLKSFMNNNINKLYQKLYKKKINNKIEESKENHLPKKCNKVKFHQKMKTSLIGECLNKLELPSNSNIINSLKKANEDYGKYNENSGLKLCLHKNITNHIADTIKKKQLIRNSSNIIINKPKISIIKNNDNSLITPIKEGKKTSIYIRNHINALSLTKNTSIFLNNNDNKSKNRNILLNSEGGQKINIKNNSVIKGIYSRPKCNYIDITKKISAKRLFNTSKE